MKKFLYQVLLPRLYGLYLNLIGIYAPRRAGRMALDAFIKVRQGRLRPRQRQWLQSARYLLPVISGFPVQVYRWPGDGPKVLLGHGWQSNSYRWKRLVEELNQEGYDIYAFDAPGHGDSGGDHLHVPLYADVLHQLRKELDPSILIGHSMGGMAILYDLFLRPSDRIEKVVSIGAPARFVYVMDAFQRVVGVNRRVRAAIDQHCHEWVGRTVEDFNSIAFSENLSIPGLLIHDIEDEVISYQASVAVHKSWKESRLVLTKGFGHSMHVSEVNRCIADYLAGRELKIETAAPPTKEELS